MAGVRLLSVTIKLGVLLVLLAGCAGLPFQKAEPSPTAAVSAAPQNGTRTPAPTPGVTPTRGPVTLRLWLPPQFDPAGKTPGGELLKARLSEFSSRRPSVRVEVRIKAVDGPGGLLETLTTASAAAPLALPDLVALPRPTLEAAALKGLLRPFDGFTQTMDGEDWYDYARQLARLQNSTFGLPFAGDALLMVYRPQVVSQPPADLASALQIAGPLAFPAADPQALFTLALYQAAGGAIQDDQERPFLDASTLANTLTFYKDAENSKLLPFWLTQFQNDGQSWDAFRNNQADLVITWASRYLKDLPADTAAAPIPTPSGKPFTLATGWVWALASPNPDHQSLSVELANFLTESAFLAEWTSATGYLPTRPSALTGWKTPSMQPVASQIMLSARLYPPGDILASLGLPLEKATTEVLKLQSEPQSAAQEAAQSLAAP